MLLSIGVLVLLLFGTLYNDYIEDPASIAVQRAVAGERDEGIPDGESVIPEGIPGDDVPFGDSPADGTNNRIEDRPEVVSTVPLDESEREQGRPDDPRQGDDIELSPEPDPISTDPDFDPENPPTDPREPGQPEPGIGPSVPPSLSESENDDSGCPECDCGKDFLFGVGGKILDEIGGLFELAWNLITSPIQTAKGLVKGVVTIVKSVIQGEFDEAAKSIIPKTFELSQVYNNPNVPQSVKCGLLGEAVVEVVSAVGGPGKIAKFTKKFKLPKGTKPPRTKTPKPKPDVDPKPSRPTQNPDADTPASKPNGTNGAGANNSGKGNGGNNGVGSNGGGNNGNNNTGGVPPKKPDEPNNLPVPRKGKFELEKGAKLDADELAVGEAFAQKGYDVKGLKTASDKGISGKRTPDLYVDGIGKVDVYTPKNINANTISRAIEKKNSQAGTIVVRGDVPDRMRYIIANRVWGKPKAQNIQTIIFEKSGDLTIFARPQ